MKTGAIIVLFNPEIEELDAALKLLVPQVDEICLVDNSSVSLADHFSRKEKIHYIPLLNNRGLAAAQNIGIEHFKKQRYEFVLFSDQDSSCSQGLVEQLREVYMELEEKGYKVATVGPTPLNKKTGKSYYRKKRAIRDKFRIQYGNKTFSITEMYSIISSYSLIRLSTFDEIGTFEEDLFIDGVDNEWGWRALALKGMKSFLIDDLAIYHFMGGKTKLPIKKSSAFRLYFQYRNFIILSRRDYTPAFWKWHCLWTYILKLFFYPVFESPRLQNLKNMLRGIRDGFRYTRNDEKSINVE